MHRITAVSVMSDGCLPRGAGKGKAVGSSGTGCGNWDHAAGGQRNPVVPTGLHAVARNAPDAILGALQ
jgi:hypothetical protein